MKKPFTKMAIVIFSLMALLHMLRLILAWTVVVGGLIIPMWVSVVGCLLPGGLAFMLSRECRTL